MGSHKKKRRIRELEDEVELLNERVLFVENTMMTIHSEYAEGLKKLHRAFVWRS